jgi:anaerobic magnesium-protoporphyrin IX monomethyl ester cyclase
MKSSPVALVAFEEFDNLGVRYVASVLSENGYYPVIIDFSKGKENILKSIKKLKPLVVGFSVIFQYNIQEFGRLIRYLRKMGIGSHFTAGGQFASMRYNDLFSIIPSLDSIVRFEGEYTFLELVRCIHSGVDWTKLKGLAWKEKGRIIANPLRKPETDLDNFPFPVRTDFKFYALGKKFATLLAGRGCTNNCSFCNNTEYIRQSSATFKRLRKPERVADEIEFLHKEKGCSIFLFEDDDFPVKTTGGTAWTELFCKEIRRKGLSGKIMWKINCRPDEIGYENFAMMKENGLYLTFLGIDDGTDNGLLRLNKHMTIRESLYGIGILKKLEIDFDYGFMLFQPSSTFRTVNDNLSFLKQLCDDGIASATFLKLRPYFDTEVEKELGKDGRLKGKPGFLDYNFTDNSLDNYYKFISKSFMEWISDPDGLVNVTKWARIYLAVFSHFYKMTPPIHYIKAEVRKEVAESNRYLLEIMTDLSHIFEKGDYNILKDNELNSYSKNIKVSHRSYRDKVVKQVNELCRIAESQNLMHLIKI